MTNNEVQVSRLPQLAPVSHEVLSKLILEQDLAKLTPSQRLEYVIGMYSRLGLDPVAGGLDLITLNGKLRLYANKTMASQLSSKHGVKCEILSQVTEGDMRIVTARATAADGRASDDVGAVGIKGLAGETLANALMKAVTKAKRRAVLSCVGLGLLDESEVDTIPGARKVTDDGPSNRVSYGGGVRSHERGAGAVDAGMERPEGGPDAGSGRPQEGSGSEGPSESWWLEPIDKSKPGLTWQKCATENPDWLLEIVKAAVAEKGKPTEESDAGWTKRELSAFHALRRFNPKAMADAKAKRSAWKATKPPESPAAAPEAPPADFAPPWEPDAAQGIQEALPDQADPWAEGWEKQWCMVGPDPEATWVQVVSEQADFIRDMLKKAKLSHGPDFTKWPLPAQKALKAVQAHNPLLLQKK